MDEKHGIPGLDRKHNSLEIQKRPFYEFKQAERGEVW
jgi:hypothetical protein